LIEVGGSHVGSKMGKAPGAAGAFFVLDDLQGKYTRLLVFVKWY
jgi:hypothetical protein